MTTFSGQTWTDKHPHANDKQWIERYWLGRSVLWVWAKCDRCDKRTAVASGAGGYPICDECAEKEMGIPPSTGESESGEGTR